MTKLINIVISLFFMGSSDEPIMSLLENITTNLVIPKFQRPFVWTQERIYDLVDSIVRGYPPGMIYLWNKTANSLARSRVEWHDAVGAGNVNFILDGQQRLRSLFMMLSKPEKLEQNSTVQRTNGIGKSPPLFTKRNTKTNRIKNSRNHWVDMDIFINLNEVKWENLEKGLGGLEEVWISSREIENIKEEVELLTEFEEREEKDKTVNEYITAVIWGGTRGNRKWTQSEKLIKNYVESDKGIRFVSIHVLEHIDEYIEKKWDCKWDKKNPTIRQVKQIFREMANNINNSTITQFVTSVEFTQLTHLFSRINLTPMKLNDFDLLVAKTYDEGYNFEGSVISLNLRSTLEKCMEKKRWLRNFFQTEKENHEEHFKLLIQTLALISNKKGTIGKYLLEIDKNDLCNLKMYDDAIPQIAAANHEVLDSMQKAISTLANVEIKHFKELRFVRIFPILPAAIYMSRKSSININNFLKKYIFREIFDADMLSGGNKPYHRFEEIRKEIKGAINTNRLPDINNVTTRPIPNLSREEFANKVNFDSIKPLLFLNFSFTLVDNNNTSKIKSKPVIDLNNDLKTINRTDTLHQHHIFPRKLLEKSSVDKSIINHPSNFTLLTKKTNKDIDDDDPRDYLNDVIFSKKNLKEIDMNKVLYSHLLPKRSWWASISQKDKNNKYVETVKKVYNEFIEKRREIIKAAAESLM